jgi:hypothetical protein
MPAAFEWHTMVVHGESVRISALQVKQQGFALKKYDQHRLWRISMDILFETLHLKILP